MHWEIKYSATFDFVAKQSFTPVSSNQTRNMASTASASPSAHSHRRTESGEDSDSWQQISSNEASIFFPSPASGSGSMNSWVVGSYPANVERSPQGMSPLQLDKDSQNMFSFSFPDQPEASFVAATSVTNNQFTSESYLGQQQLVTDQDFMFSGAFDGRFPPTYILYHYGLY